MDPKKTATPRKLDISLEDEDLEEKIVEYLQIV
jgi:hypothetical protein